jgi:hypothetical protein
MKTQTKPDIKVVKIKLPSELIFSEMAYICDLHKENWDEANGLPYPKMYASVDYHDKTMVIPMIKRVLEDLVQRVDDFIDIADDNLYFQKSSIAASNDKKGQKSLNDSIKHYSDVKKGLQIVKRSIIAAAKRR